MSYYVPIFAKIVDSSLWAEPDFVVKVFITMLAKKDKDNVCRGNAFNIARWSNKTEEEVLEALKILASTDTKRVEPQAYDGRRIEKVSDGWMILNGEVYQKMMREANRKQYLTEKQREYRQQSSQPVPGGPHLSQPVPEASGKSVEGNGTAPPKPVKSGNVEQALAIYDAYPRKVARGDALKAIGKALTKMDFEKLLAVTQAFAAAVQGEDMKFIPYPASWFNAEHFFDDPAMWTLKPGAPATNGKALSIFELKTVLEAKSKAAQDLKNAFAAEGPLTTDWTNEEAREKFKVLRKEISFLTQQIASRA